MCHGGLLQGNRVEESIWIAPKASPIWWRLTHQRRHKLSCALGKISQQGKFAGLPQRHYRRAGTLKVKLLFFVYDPHPQNSSDWYLLSDTLQGALLFSYPIWHSIWHGFWHKLYNIPYASLPMYLWNPIWQIILTKFFNVKIFYLTYFYDSLSGVHCTIPSGILSGIAHDIGSAIFLALNLLRWTS